MLATLVATQYRYAESRYVTGLTIEPPLPPPGLDRADREDGERDRGDGVRRSPIRISLSVDGRPLLGITVAGKREVLFDAARLVLRAGQVLEVLAPSDWTVTLAMVPVSP